MGEARSFPQPSPCSTLCLLASKSLRIFCLCFLCQLLFKSFFAYFCRAPGCGSQLQIETIRSHFETGTIISNRGIKAQSMGEP
jgi:hypothetical protein